MQYRFSAKTNSFESGDLYRKKNQSKSKLINTFLEYTLGKDVLDDDTDLDVAEKRQIILASYTSTT